MARPVYIICSESGVEDEHTRKVSLFNVVEKIQFVGDRSPAIGRIMQVQLVEYRVTAVWMSGEDDNDNVEYESKLAIYLPGAENPQEKVLDNFSFSKAHPLIRFIITTSGPPFESGGLMRIQSLIRKVGDESWLRQEYPIIIEYVVPEAPPQ